jgi:hypothetical protein
VSEENKIKSPNQHPNRQPLSAEQKAQIIRNRLAKRPVIMIRYPNGKLNTRFILSLAILVIALVAALIIITR